MYKDRITWIEHKGRKIIYFDYSNLSPADVINMLVEVGAVESKQEKNSIIGLNNFENMSFNLSIINAFNKDIEKHSDRYKITANLGVKGLVKVMFDTASKLTKQEMKCFSNRDEALDWLVSK